MLEIIQTTAKDHDGIEYVRPGLFYDEKLLDLPYVWASRYPKYSTSEEYLKILRRFINYLFERPIGAFDIEKIFSFWTYVTAGDIRTWQQARAQERQATGRGASWDTVKGEAEIVAQFFGWAKEQGVPLLYSPKTQVVLQRSQAEDDLLKGMAAKRREKKVYDYEDINIPKPIDLDAKGDIDDEDLYLFVAEELPNDSPVFSTSQLIKVVDLFFDPVYKAITYAGYHTGLRNHEALGIPTITAGLGFVCDPASLRKKLRDGKKEMILNVEGKSKDPRKIPFEIKTWLEIMAYWWPIREQRKRKYKEETGKDLPAKVLWISKDLKPLYCDPENEPAHKGPKSSLQKAFYYVGNDKRNSKCTALQYGFRANYYKLRHTFATRFVYEAMTKTKDYKADNWISDIHLRNQLMKRMGHRVLSTTFENYVHEAALLHLEAQGKSATWFPERDFIDHLNNISKVA